ncbi:aspartate aminotransferase family protein [Cryobacterium sp. TMT2-23]|uniref:aspartate aminotransferase family protein n=1 Tax=Cryobacterium sp. TMT2-23 TaxID=1259252 RepID=UPI00106AD4E0|nr:aspartate aminotransferase family protein [Cryobacterium sp. TMT2-23]TFD29118.1 aspartate aminotransferase family protein [Cryobacterium sp. TMT2-23]
MIAKDQDHRIRGSVDALNRAEVLISGGVTSGLRRALEPQALSFESGHGSHLKDVDGNEYIDYVLGWGPAILGHTHPAVTEAVEIQVRKGQVFGAIHPGERLAAERLLACVPQFSRVLFSNTGTEAVQVALRLARAATGRNLIVKCAGAYHGWHDTMLLSYHQHTGGHRAVSNTLGQNPRALDDVLVIDFNDVESVQSVFRQYGQDIAAVIIDPVLSNGGLIEPDPAFLTLLREQCDRTGALLIYDEVITGFRIALGGAVELYGVVPDLAIYAKAMANGFPISAVAGQPEVIDLVTQGVVHAGTYNGNAIATAATAVTLEFLALPGTYELLWAHAQALAKGLQNVFDVHGVDAQAHHLGPIVQILFGKTHPISPRDFDETDWTLWNQWSRSLSPEGLFLLPHGRMFLSTAHTAEDIQRTIKAFEGVIQHEKDRF